MLVGLNSTTTFPTITFSKLEIRQSFNKNTYKYCFVRFSNLNYGLYFKYSKDGYDDIIECLKRRK